MSSTYWIDKYEQLKGEKRELELRIERALAELETAERLARWFPVNNARTILRGDK